MMPEFLKQFRDKTPIYFIDKEDNNEIRQGIIENYEISNFYSSITFSCIEIYYVKFPIIIGGIYITCRTRQLSVDEIYATKKEAYIALSKTCEYKKDICIMLELKDFKECGEGNTFCKYCTYYKKHKNMNDNEKNLTSKFKIDDDVYYREISTLIFKITKVKLTKKGHVYECKNISEKGIIAIENVIENCLEKV